MIFLAGEDHKIEYGCHCLAALDLTHLLMDEVLPVAEAVGVGRQYRKLSESGKIDFKEMRQWLKLLYRKPERWIAYQINKAEPFRGSKETIEYLKRWGYVKIITDDPLMGLPECNETVKEKLGGRIEIIPTAKMKIEDGNWILKNIRTKPQILKELIDEYKPDNLLSVVQGINDIPFARSSKKEYGGKVIAVNSYSQELKNMSDYHIPFIAEAPELLERILLENRLT